MKKVLSLAAILLLVALSARAYDFMVDGLCYKITGSNPNTVKVCAQKEYASTSSSPRYPGLEGDIVIPQTVTNNGTPYTVTSIDDYCFYYSNYNNSRPVTSVTIPASVMYIGKYAFAITYVQAVNISPNSQLSTIGEWAFWACNMKSIYLPNSLTSIGVNAFFRSLLQSVTLPNGLTTIAENTFANCVNLSSVTLPSSLTSISGGAFSGCSALSSITLPASLTTIGERAFSSAGLTSITIPSSVTSIGKELFYSCKSLASAKLQNTVMSEGQFLYCSALTSVTFTNGITEIPDNAFIDTGLTTLSLPSSVTAIGNSAFARCKFSSLSIPSHITSIGGNAFSSCENLTNVTIPSSVTSIGGNVFSSCDALKSATILNSTIGDGEFWSCDQLETVTFGESLKTIGANAFNSCSALVKVNMNNIDFTLLKKIPNYNTQLKNVVIGNNVTAIPASVCQNWTGLESVTLPNNFSSIGNSAFSGCTQLMDVYSLRERPITIDASVFNGVQVSGYCDLHVPVGSVGRYRAMNVWKDFYVIDEGGGHSGGTGIKGDVNEDGVVSGADVTALYSILLGE